MSFTYSQMRAHLQAEGIDFVVNAAAQEFGERRFASLVYDSRQSQAASVFCAVAGDRSHGRDFLEAALEGGAGGLIVEAPTDWPLGKATDGVPTLVTPDARAALAAAARGHLRESGVEVVAITGSNGKTTTKDFTVAALSSGRRVGGSPGNLNSSWGLPAAVLASSRDLEVLVLEMGASAPGEIDALCEIAPPTVGVITNVAPAHLEFFGSEEAVARTKAAVLRSLPDDGAAVLPRDDRFYGYFCEEAGDARVLSFGADRDSSIRIDDVEMLESGLRVSIGGAEAQLPVFSSVNASNAAAAIAVAKIFGISAASALSSITGVALSPHRSRILPRREGFVLDDSYNANPASMSAALEALATRPAEGRRAAVLGRMAELGDIADVAHRTVLELAVTLGLDVVFVIGEEFARAALAVASPKVLVAHELAELERRVLAEAEDADCWLIKGSRSAGLERVVEALVGGGAVRSSKGEVA